MNHEESGLEDELAIEPKIAVMDIVFFELDPFFKREAVAPLSDPEGGESRADREDGRGFIFQVFDHLFLGQRPGADNTHVPSNDIPNLGELVERGFPKPLSDGGDPWIDLQFEVGFPLVHQRRIGGEQGLQLRIGVLVHGAKLQTAERSSPLPHSWMSVKNRPGGREFDGDHADEKERRKKNEHKERDD